MIYADLLIYAVICLYLCSDVMYVNEYVRGCAEQTIDNCWKVGYNLFTLFQFTLLMTMDVRKVKSDTLCTLLMGKEAQKRGTAHLLSLPKVPVLGRFA